MRDFAALPLGHLPDGLAGLRLDQLAVEFELDDLRPGARAAYLADRRGVGNIDLSVGHRLPAGLALGIMAITLRLRAVVAHMETSVAATRTKLVLSFRGFLRREFFREVFNH